MKFLVIGDTIIDEEILLKAKGLSLETPTIKTEFISSKTFFGGAANVAKNLIGDNHEISFLTSLSKENLKLFSQKYPAINIFNFFLGKDNIKSRYWIQHGDAKYKYLQINNLNDFNQKSKSYDLDFNHFDVVAFSDYRCGLITPELVSKCINSSCKTYASSQISSQPSNYEYYQDVDIIVCNENEASFIDRTDNICITKGDQGCFFNGVDYAACKIKKPINTIGAGDCFFAAFLIAEDPTFANKRAAKFLSEIE